jgi:hypothetical protein
MRKSNLVLHCGATAATREQVCAITTPARTTSWVPLPHGTLLGQVQQVLQANGLAVVSEAHGLTRYGARYFGLLQVANGQNADDFGLVVGVRNSHDKTFPAALALGATVFCCDNLSFVGEVKLARKHTAYIERDLPGLIYRAVQLLGALRRGQEDRFAAYRRAELSDGQAHDLIVRSLDARVVPVTKLPAVLTEWREPRHPEFRDGGRTAWRLLNAFTEALKGNLTELPRRTQALHGLLDAACGLVSPAGYREGDDDIQVAQAG